MKFGCLFILFFSLSFSANCQLSCKSTQLNDLSRYKGILSSKETKTPSLLVQQNSNLQPELQLFLPMDLKNELHASGGHKFLQAIVGDIGFVIGAGGAYVLRINAQKGQPKVEGQALTTTIFCAGAGILGAAALTTAIGGSDLDGRFWSAVKGAFVGTLITSVAGVIASRAADDMFSGIAVAAIVMPFAIGGMTNRGYYHW